MIIWQSQLKKRPKKKSQEQKREHTREQKKQILAIDINITKAFQKKKIKAKYFNCNKKGYYANNCIKLKK